MFDCSMDSDTVTDFEYIVLVVVGMATYSRVVVVLFKHTQLVCW